MTKTPITAGGRPPKREGQRLSKNRTFRVRGELDDQLAHAAAASGKSVSEEIEYRLEQSFGQEHATGGPVIRKIAHTVAATFWVAGENYARWNDVEAAPETWIRDQGCFREAVMAVAEMLLSKLPNNSPDEIAITFEALKGRIATKLVNSGRLKLSE